MKEKQSEIKKLVQPILDHLEKEKIVFSHSIDNNSLNESILILSPDKKQKISVLFISKTMNVKITTEYGFDNNGDSLYWIHGYDFLMYFDKKNKNLESIMTSRQVMFDLLIKDFIDALNLINTEKKN